MALNDDVLQVFARADSEKQARILRRIGPDTDAAEKVLNHLRSRHPNKHAAVRRVLEP